MSHFFLGSRVFGQSLSEYALEQLCPAKYRYKVLDFSAMLLFETGLCG